jgi:hypothetical protein
VAGFLLQERMMKAIHVRKHIDSGLVDAIPELSGVYGQDVDIFIVPQVTGEASSVETLETFLGDSLHRPPPSPEEMEEIRAAAEHDPALAAALWLSEHGGLDVDAILEMRNAERDPR